MQQEIDAEQRRVLFTRLFQGSLWEWIVGQRDSALGCISRGLYVMWLVFTEGLKEIVNTNGIPKRPEKIWLMCTILHTDGSGHFYIFYK
jgi:hypothetical protein